MYSGFCHLGATAYVCFRAVVFHCVGREQHTCNEISLFFITLDASPRLASPGLASPRLAGSTVYPQGLRANFPCVPSGSPVYRQGPLCTVRVPCVPSGSPVESGATLALFLQRFGERWGALALLLQWFWKPGAALALFPQWFGEHGQALALLLQWFSMPATALALLLQWFGERWAALALFL